jgi:hypothetical protein
MATLGPLDEADEAFADHKPRLRAIKGGQGVRVTQGGR